MSEENKKESKDNKVYIALDSLDTFRAAMSNGISLIVDFKQQGLFGICPVFNTEEEAKTFIGDKDIQILTVELNK